MSKLLEVEVLVGNPTQWRTLEQVVRGRQTHVVLDQELGHNETLIYETMAAARHSSTWSLHTS